MVQSLFKPCGAAFWSYHLKQNLHTVLQKFTCEKPNLWLNAIRLLFENNDYIIIWWHYTVCCIVHCVKWHYCYSVRKSDITAIPSEKVPMTLLVKPLGRVKIHVRQAGIKFSNQSVTMVKKEYTLCWGWFYRN